MSEDTEKQSVGRPKHEPTQAYRDIITKLLTMGVPQTHIASILGIGVGTLRDYYMDLIETVKPGRVIKLLETAFTKAIEHENVTMLIYLLKTLGGLKEAGMMDETNKIPETIGRITLDILPPKETKKEEPTDETD